MLEFQRHHIVPLSMGGSDVETNVRWLCPTAHANVHEMLRMMVAAGEPLSQTRLQRIVDRPVSRYAVVLAQDGYIRWRGAQ